MCLGTAWNWTKRANGGALQFEAHGRDRGNGPKGHKMRNAFAIIAVSLALSGCANVSNPGISYLGFAPAADEDEAQETPAGETPEAVKHVDSNRVLGAMAFEKVTRAKVDPTRLVKSRR